MIQPTKNRYIQAAAVVVLIGILAAGTPSYAELGDNAPNNSGINASSVNADAPKVFVPGIGTASGSVASANAADQTQNKSSLKEKAAKILDAISKHPSGREAKMPDWKIAQDKAVLDARAGNYDLALPVLERLHNEHPQDLGIATDQAAILGWAGRDADAVAAYKALPEGNRPDYLIDAIGHSYRNLHQPDEALTVYRLGLQSCPDNQSFMAGEIFSLLESNHSDEAVAKAQQASNAIAQPVEALGLAIKQAFHANAIELARKGDYKNALPALAALHKKYPDDFGIATDYVAVLSWAGRDAEAVAQFRALPSAAQGGGDVPDYVLDAAAHSYRNLHQSKQALALYKAALDKSSDNITYAVGVIYSLSDLGRSAEALKIATAQLAKHPEKPAELVKAYTYVERRRAIDLARGGHYEQALKILRQLRVKYPSDITEVMDYIAVSGWAGHDKDAVKEYEKIAKQPMPDYVLEAVAHSYRNLHQSEQALTVYRRGLKQSPRNEVFAAGIIRCLDDLGRYGEGVSVAKGFTARYGDHLEVLLGGGEAANFNDEAIEALNFYERAGSLAPQNHEAERGLIHAEDRVGAPELALKRIAKRPGLMKSDEYRAIVGDADSNLVRWGTLEPASEATRYTETDQALATLDAHIGEWSAKNDPAVYPNIMRARFDRLIALRDRQRMQDVVNGYNALVQEGVELPPYALAPVGDAYLALREPEIARDIFLKILQAEPDNFEARRLLAYAYLECGQYDEAYATIDKLQDDQPKWVYLKGEPERQPNPNRALAEIDAGELRGYGDLLQEGDNRLTPLVEAAPYDARNRAAAGNLYMTRGWPRKAMEQFQIGKSIQDSRDVANETGIAMAHLDLQNFREAEAVTQNLMQRFPENLGVQRANRLLEVHNMMELDVHAGYQFAPSENSTAANVPHGQGYSVGAELYSSPIDYNWRLFAGHDYAHEHSPNAEGIIDYNRSNVGAEYRNGDVTASVAPTLNEYNSHERVGVDGKGNYTFNDMWSAGIAAELFSSATPLRALNAGITANMYDVNGKWRQSESRSVTFDAYAMTFSDSNLRTVQDAEYIQRLYTDPRFELDMEGDLAASQNSKDDNRLYYNPKMDLLASAGLRGTHTLYRRYETLYQHSLLVLPGLYAEQHHSVTPAWTIRYEQRVHYNDTLNAGVGVNYSHQRYDGVGSDAVSLMMDVVERF